jgi:hypothetical protein
MEGFFLQRHALGRLGGERACLGRVELGCFKAVREGWGTCEHHLSLVLRVGRERRARAHMNWCLGRKPNFVEAD